MREGGRLSTGRARYKWRATSPTSYLEQHQSVPNQFCPARLFGLLRCCCRTGPSVHEVAVGARKISSQKPRDVKNSQNVYLLRSVCFVQGGTFTLRISVCN